MSENKETANQNDLKEQSERISNALTKNLNALNERHSNLENLGDAADEIHINTQKYARTAVDVKKSHRKEYFIAISAVVGVVIILIIVLVIALR